MCKDSTEIVTINEEIRIAGLSLQKSGLPLNFESLGELWHIYGDKYRYHIPNAIKPIVEYAIALNTVPDYITGCAVTQTNDIDKECISYIIPKGKYIKDTFRAETFEELTTEKMAGRDVRGWAQNNGVKINDEFAVEVYPIEAIENKCVEMYTLTPVKE